MGKYLTYLLAWGALPIYVFYPFIGLLAYVCFAILAPESLWFWEFGGQAGGGFSFVIAIALLIGWAFQSFGNWQFGRAGLTVFSIVFFLLWTAAAYPLSSNLDVAWPYLYSLFKIVLPFMVGITLIKDVKQLSNWPGSWSAPRAMSPSS